MVAVTDATVTSFVNANSISMATLVAQMPLSNRGSDRVSQRNFSRFCLRSEWGQRSEKVKWIPAGDPTMSSCKQSERTIQYDHTSSKTSHMV